MSVEPLAVDAAELAIMLRVSLRTIRTHDTLGKLPRAVRFGRCKRWDVGEIKSWIAVGAPDRSAWEARKALNRAH